MTYNERGKTNNKKNILCAMLLYDIIDMTFIGKENEI